MSRFLMKWSMVGVLVAVWSIGQAETTLPQEGSSLTNTWEDPDKFRQLLQENKEAILQSKYFKENAYCPALLDEVINNKVEYIKPVEKVETNDALADYVEKHYGCKNFKVDDSTYQAGPNHALMYEAEAPYFIYDIPENGKPKYFSVFPFGDKNLGAPDTKEIDYEGESSAGHLIYEISKQCKVAGGLSIPGVGSNYEYSKGGLIKSKFYGFLLYAIQIRGRIKIDFDIVDIDRIGKKHGVYCVASSIKLGE